MKQGVARIPSKNCVRGPEGETGSSEDCVRGPKGETGSRTDT